MLMTRGHVGDLPCLRLRCAGWRLLYLLRKQPRPIKYDLEAVERVEDEVSKTVFRWRRGINRAWRLTVR